MLTKTVHTVYYRDMASEFTWDPRDGTKQCSACLTHVEDVPWEAVTCECKEDFCMCCYVEHKEVCPALAPESEEAEVEATENLVEVA